MEESEVSTSVVKWR